MSRSSNARSNRFAAGADRRAPDPRRPGVPEARRAARRADRVRTWDEVELLEVPLLARGGTADAEALGVRPKPMRAVWGRINGVTDDGPRPDRTDLRRRAARPGADAADPRRAPGGGRRAGGRRDPRQHCAGDRDPTKSDLALLYDLGFATLMFTVGMQVPLHDERMRGALGRGAAAVLAAIPLAFGERPACAPRRRRSGAGVRGRDRLLVGGRGPAGDRRDRA